MTHQITLHGVGYTRSSRCLWTLLELGLEHEYIENGKLIRSDELRALQPQAKLPVAIIDGEPLFESSAICTHLCDLAPEKGLLGGPGTRERALHLQWMSFALTEVETWLWSSFKHIAMYPEEKRVPAVLETNAEEIRNGLRVLSDALGREDYLVANRFSVTDIVVSWPVNWARRMKFLDGMDPLSRYLDRLFERPHCRLNPE